MSAHTHYYFKFDLTVQAIRQWPDLYKQYMHHGALRVAVIIESEMQWPNRDELEAYSVPDVEWVAIKVPSIDGTEIWFMPSSAQAALEQQLGFGKKSEPLYKTQTDVLKMGQFIDPFSKKEVRFIRQAKSDLSNLSGIKIGTSHQPWPAEKIASAKDSGSLAFEISPA